MGFVLASLVFLPWPFIFSIGGPKVVGQNFFDNWNMGSLEFQLPL